MQTYEVKAQRDRLSSFLKPVLARMGREERRKWGAFWVQGLLMQGGRKTAAGIASRNGGDAQALQQFVNQSPWDWAPVRAVLAENCVVRMSPKCAWVVDDTGFPKKGDKSVGVMKQYSGTLGKIGNCQIGVSLNYATDEGCIPLDFELYLPEEWAQDRQRREISSVPAWVEFKEKWRLSIDMIEGALALKIPRGVVIADAGYGNVGDFRSELRRLGLSYVVGVSPGTGVYLTEQSMPEAARGATGRPRTRHHGLPKPLSLLEVATQLEANCWKRVVWRQGTKGEMRGRFTAVRAQPSHGHNQKHVTDVMGWLLIEWPEGEPEPTKYWLSNLGLDTEIRDLVYWAKIRWWVEQNYEQLKQEVGLSHFEGRTWKGWHHHVTLCMMAFDFLVMESLRAKRNFWVDAAESETGNADDVGTDTWILSDMQAEAP